MMQELDQVVLTENITEHHLEAGDMRTVVLTHENGAGYMLEFMTVDGETIAVVTLHTHQVRAIAADEIAHVRRLESASA